MAILGGIGGGVTRDIILNKVPSALTNPAYITVCIIFGIVGYRLACGKGQLLREGLFQFATSFPLTGVSEGPRPTRRLVPVSCVVLPALPRIGAVRQRTGLFDR
jgi:hypothetical protein